MHRETIGQTLAVAIGVCVVCSVVVSSAAVLLKERQERNKRIDINKNILAAAGRSEEQLDITNQQLEELFERIIETHVVDMRSGEFLSDVDPGSIDHRKDAKNPKLSQAISDKADLAKIKRRADRRLIHLYREDGRLKRIILPVHGKGLWSTMYGFLALEPDGQTIQSLAFYEHGETPGLGAEIDNRRWKRKWVGKKAFDEDGQLRIEVVKEGMGKGDPQYRVDGISGATITGRGVRNLVHYWLGDQGYGPALEKLRQKKEDR